MRASSWKPFPVTTTNLFLHFYHLSSQPLNIPILSLFFLVLSVYCYQPISLHPHAPMLSHVTPWTAGCQAPVHGLLQARILEWAAISFSIYINSKRKIC